MNTYGKFLLCLCFLVVAADFTSAQEPTGDHVQSWQMAVLKKNGSVYESIPFYQPLSMTRTDSYQLYLGFNGKGFCYVIQEDDEGTLPFAYRKTVSPGDRITLPGEGRDFIAAGLPGTSRLYVIVSDHPRANLEKLLEHYEQGTDVVSLDRSILSEVFAIKEERFIVSGRA